MRKFLSRGLLACLLLINMVFTAQAQMAQVPLLTQTSAVEPNLVFVFDDSASMKVREMYQFGPGDGWGVKNPETGKSVEFTSGSYAQFSPDVNLMYYDPRVKYKLRVNADGSDNAAGSLPSSTSFKVYFYNPIGAGSSILHVSSVTIINGGSKFPTRGMTMTFTAPPLGGTRATGTVTVNGSGAITSINVTNGGSGYKKVPTISLFKKGRGKNFQYTVNMAADPVSGSHQNRLWDGVGSVANLSSYFSTGSPAGYLPDVGSPLAVGADASVIYPNLTSSSVSKYPKFAARSDCTGVNPSGSANAGQSFCTWAQELQNYANWSLYHATRVDLARTGIGLAFKPLAATFRLGWGTINRLETRSNLDAGVSLFTSSRKADFYTWLYSKITRPTGDTPNRLAMNKVGQYFSRSDSNGPWGTNPSFSSVSTSASTTTAGDTTAIKAAHASCRRSNMLLMTDGYWNGASSSLGNIDDADGPVISSPSGSTFQYKRTFPYKDATANTLADVGMQYWVNDLRPDLPNNVPAVTGINESFWQNVSFYGIGLGVYGTLPQTEATLSNLSAGTTLWPVASANSPTAIDDMWHVAINSRGQFLNAKDSDTLTESVDKMMSTINKISSSQSGVAVSTANLINGTRKYTPQYTTGSWIGNVTARNLDPLNGNEVSTAWQVEGKDPITGVPVSTIAQASQRQIFVGSNAVAGNKTLPFTYSDMYAAGLTGLMSGTVNADLIDYLRGDASKEGEFGIYRTREGRLGDIVNSTPVLIKGGIDLGYDKLPAAIAGGSTYAAFVSSKATRAEGVLFVGANDGMLHAFRDGTNGAPDTAGEEIFAYVPKAVLPNLPLLADKAYSHRYYVDGPLVETDAYLNDTWKNIILGTTGAGAKAVYAVDVTDPLFVDGSSVMWEISSASTGFSELGHVLTDVQTGVLSNGQWVAIFGNGYFSASGTARLFIVNLETGALLKEIDTAVGGGNGLGGVRLVRDANQRILGAYADDLKGNLWKFDLSSSTAAGWGMGLSGSALLAVGSTRPFTAAPAIIAHPNGGSLVSIASGKFFEATDVATTSQQTAYGVWDSVAFGGSVTPVGVVQTDTSNLVQQTISSGSTVTRSFVTSDLTTATQDITYFSVSANPIDWASKRGWFIDLPNTGERVVFPLESLAGRYIALDTISPSNVSNNACIQAGQGTGWLYLVDGLTGSGPTEQIFDTNGDGNVDSGDELFSGSTARADGRNTWLKVDALSNSEKTVYAGITGSDGSGTTVKLSCTLLNNCPVTAPPPGTGSIKSREWRQLFMR